MLVLPPRRRPPTTSGAQPLSSVQVTEAPRSLSERASGPIGRRRIWSSPVKTASPLLIRVADPVAIRRVVPELRTSITLAGVVGRPAKPRTTPDLRPGRIDLGTQCPVGIHRREGIGRGQRRLDPALPIGQGGHGHRPDGVGLGTGDINRPVSRDCSQTRRICQSLHQRFIAEQYSQGQLSHSVRRPRIRWGFWMRIPILTGPNAERIPPTGGLLRPGGLQSIPERLAGRSDHATKKKGYRFNRYPLEMTLSK